MGTVQFEHLNDGPANVEGAAMMTGTCTVCGLPIRRLGHSSWYHDEWSVAHVAQPRTTYSTTTNPSSR